MKLLIDQGNTRIKWRLDGIEEPLGGELANGSDWSNWLALLQAKSAVAGGLQRVAVASVAGADFRQRFSDCFATAFSLVPVFYGSEARRSINGIELTNSYASPNTMGVDRWLAMVAAVAQFPSRAMVLVDAGSAVNIEVLSSCGLHQGGYIVPGIQLMKTSLLKNTAKVVFGGTQNVIIEPGKCTGDAVNNGVAIAVVGMVERVLQSANNINSNGDCLLILTGGDSAYLLPFFDNAVHRPELVLDGLAIVDQAANFESAVANSNPSIK